MWGQLSLKSNFALILRPLRLWGQNLCFWIEKIICKKISFIYTRHCAHGHELTQKLGSGLDSYGILLHFWWAFTWDHPEGRSTGPQGVIHQIYNLKNLPSLGKHCRGVVVRYWIHNQMIVDSILIMVTFLRRKKYAFFAVLIF